MACAPDRFFIWLMTEHFREISAKNYVADVVHYIGTENQLFRIGHTGIMNRIQSKKFKDFPPKNNFVFIVCVVGAFTKTLTYLLVSQ